MLKISKRLTELNRHLHEHTFQTVHPWLFTDINILKLPGQKGLAKESIPVRKAWAEMYVAEHLPIDICEGELLIGNPAMCSVEFGTSCVGYLTDAEAEYFARHGLSEGSLGGHHPPRWETLLNKGTLQLKQEVVARLSKELAKDEPLQEAVDNLRGMLLALDALNVYASRCAQQAIAAAEITQDKERRAELWHMAETCLHVPLHPARTLQQALQSYWLAYAVFTGAGEMLPLGRLDQIFAKFYEADLAAGRLTEGQAVDLLGCFLIKCNELVTLPAKEIPFSPNYRSYRGVIGQSIATHEAFAKNYYYHEEASEDSIPNKFFGQEANNRMMTAVVGGVAPDGQDATNTLSYLFIELVHELRLLFPTLGARIDAQTPLPFLHLLGKVLRHGQGEPIVYNDEAIIGKYAKLGVPAEEIRDYSSDGCWEVLIPGRTDFAYSLIFALQCLEWTLNNGVTVKSGVRESVATGELMTFASFEDLYKAFLVQLEKQMQDCWEFCVRTQGNASVIAPDPLFSALADDCIDRAADFANGGARFQFRCLMLCGFADTVDSLAAIKKLVFDDKELTLQELNQALLANFVGHERLRIKLLRGMPKYGNCDPYADAIAARIITDYSDIIRQIRSQYDGFYLTGGIGTFHMYSLWGDRTAASANGRLAYDALAPNYSPVPGADKEGPLLALASSVYPDLSELMTGTPVDISINARDFEGEAGIQRITDIIMSYCEAGGQILSITATSAAELCDAMEHPESHASLRVRMGGLSAYFVQLAPEQQRKIIERFTV